MFPYLSTQITMIVQFSHVEKEYVFYLAVINFGKMYQRLSVYPLSYRTLILFSFHTE